MPVTQIDYVLLLERNYPTALFGGSCETYSKINWKDTIINKPSQAQLDSEWATMEIQLAMESKIMQLSIAADTDISTGFYSSALGIQYFYSSTREDQLNLIGLVAEMRERYESSKTVALATSQPIPSEPIDYFSVRILPTDTQKVYRPHTLSQLGAVMSDGKLFKLQVLMTFNAIKDSILAMTSVADINAVVWTSMAVV